jgi:integrase
MARKYSMTWDGEPNYRWQKMKKGQWYRVTCEALGLPRNEWTKEGSYQAANAWWLNHPANAPDPIRQAVANMTPSHEEMKRVIETAVLYRRMILAGPVENIDRFEADEILATDLVPLADPVRMERLAEVGEKIGAKAAKEFQLAANAKQFLDLERAKRRKARTYGELSASIAAIIKTTYLGKPILSADVRKIDETTVQNFYLYLRNESGREPIQQAKQFAFFRRLIRHLWSARLIDLPRNLDNTWDFPNKAKKVKEYDLGDIKTLLSKLPDRLKLYALLGLNCGMLSVDVGALRKDEIDFEEGRITRKRTKTETEKDVPTVSYKLWPTTLKLLKKCLGADSVLALSTKNGKRLVEYWLDADGKEKEKNMLRQQWKRAQTEIPHKAFRSVGSTLIYNNQTYRPWTGYYLGHTAKSLIEKHYAADTKEGRQEFDKIVEWLGKQFKL